MKYWHILIICLLALSLTACSNDTPASDTVTAPQDLGTQQIDPNITPQGTPAPSANEPAPAQDIGYDDVTTPKVSVTGIEAFGTRFDSKYQFNKLQVNFTSDKAIDWNKLVVDVDSRFFNGTYQHNSTTECKNIAGLIKLRNKEYATQGSDTQGSICLTPGRDMSPSDSLVFTATYDGKIVIQEAIAIPSVVTRTYLKIK